MPTRTEISESEEGDRGHTDLMRAALEGQTETVNALLKGGADINARDREGRTALMFASVNRHTDSAKTLLEHGADVNVRANDGGTALMLAALSGEAEIVRTLLSKGADVSAKFTETGKTALDLARDKNLTDIVHLLEAAEAGNALKRTK
jgi:ankyrin repeat protein